jgi:hypothetical protein
MMGEKASEWWEQPYKGGKMVELPGFPGPLYPPDAAEKGKAPAVDGPAAVALKRIVARLGRWEWAPDKWDDSFSNEFAHGRGGNVAESGLAGVQRQGKLDDTGWVDEKTFNLLRSVRIPEGLPNAGQPAIDATARQLLIQAWEAAQRPKAVRLQDVKVSLKAGEPHWGGAHDILEQYVAPFLAERGFTSITSRKRDQSATSRAGSKNTSDHFVGNTTAAAYDFGTFDGEDGARALAAAMGFGGWVPNQYQSFNFSAGGHSWRGQILWGAKIDHADHIHVGIRRN